MNMLPTRRLAVPPPSRPTLAASLLRATFGRASGWLLVRVVGLGSALGG
jgi:hypothetical protein